MTEESIRQYPLSVSLAVFGVGLGLGTVVGGLLADSCAVRERKMAEGLGQRLLDSLGRVIPDRMRS